MPEPADPTAREQTAPPDEEAWSLVLASWADEQAHRAYLARFLDLEGLAVAGGRYRAVLAERPQDAMALRMRDEVVRKATVFGLASLPRTRPSEIAKLPRWMRLLVVLALVVGAVFVVGLVAGFIREMLGARP